MARQHRATSCYVEVQDRGRYLFCVRCGAWRTADLSKAKQGPWYSPWEGGMWYTGPEARQPLCHAED